MKIVAIDFETANYPRESAIALGISVIIVALTFFLFLKKAANLVVHDLIDVSKSGWEDHVAQLVRERAREYGLKFEGDAMEYFNAMAGENTRQIENELEKLDLYVGERRVVTANDVRDIVPQTKNSIIFELGNAIISRQLGLALAMVDVLLEQGENAVGILLAAVVPKIKSLAQVKYYEENFRISAGKSYNEYAAALGRLPERERARLPQKKDGTGLNVYGLYMSAREAGNFTGAELRSALEECLLANRRLVTTALDPVIVFNQLLFRILATKG